MWLYHICGLFWTQSLTYEFWKGRQSADELIYRHILQQLFLACKPTVMSCFCFCELCKCIRNMTTTEWTVTWYLQIRHQKFYHHCNTKYRIIKLNSRQLFLLVFEVRFTDVWFCGISKPDTASISCFHKYGPSHMSLISCASTEKFQGSQYAVFCVQTGSGIGFFRCI
jgi:hypothetical protein